MKDSESIRIAVAGTSMIIRNGPTLALKRLPNLKIRSVGLLLVETLNDCLRTQFPDMLMINPTFGGFFDVTRFREETAGKGIGVAALISSFIDALLLSKYDASISIFDDLEALANKINLLQNIEPEEEEDSQEALSQREREIMICVAKGMTNKEIVEKPFLSVHTVITHRRNISKKLQIYSVADLTVYAIVNKLAELSDIKDLQL